MLKNWLAKANSTSKEDCRKKMAATSVVASAPASRRKLSASGSVPAASGDVPQPGRNGCSRKCSDGDESSTSDLGSSAGASPASSRAITPTHDGKTAAEDPTSDGKAAAEDPAASGEPFALVDVETEEKPAPAPEAATGLRSVKVETDEPDEDACADVFAVVKEEVDEESASAEALVPKALLEKEAAAKEENIKKEDKEKAKLSGEYQELSKEERHKKLMELLNRSQFYSNFLLEKMENLGDESKKLREKNDSRRKSVKGESAKPGSEKGGRKSKRTASDRDAAADDRENKRPRLDDGGAAAEDKPIGQARRTFDGVDISDTQPLLLTGGIMREYQLKGYQWMSTLWENGINGILADEMGLGKTIQTIALFCHLVEMGVPGPFLIVAPLSTVPNWVKEFARFAPDMPCVLYHGSAPEREKIRAKKLAESFKIPNVEVRVRNVFVTSYEIAMRDRAAFARTAWRYVVVDEGHRLKNMNCKLLKELKLYQSANRLLLTGTPLQNNLSELWSLLNFLMSEIFDDLRVFESWFSAKEMDTNASETERIVAQERQNGILSTMHQILTPFLLRRVKADVDLAIPPKKELLVYCPMTPKQTEMYEATVSHTIADLVDKKQEEAEPDVDDSGRARRKKSAVDYRLFLDGGGESDKAFDAYVERLQAFKSQRAVGDASAYVNNEARRDAVVNYSVKSRMMDMRKTTNHPYLIEYPLTDDGFFYRSDQDMVDICGKLKVCDQLLVELLRRKHKVLIFSQMTKMLDILGDYLSFRGFTFSRLDGSMGFEDRQVNIDTFNEDESTRIFLLSTRAGGLGINLTAADTVIIYDSDWNPQQDLQAQDRCHRIGQTRPVVIYRLVTANTIDEKIVERAAAKRKLEKLIIHQKKFKSQDKDGLKTTMEAISPQELLDLLHSKDHAGVVDRCRQDCSTIFTADEMDQLLDRSDLVNRRAAVDGGKKSRGATKSVFKVIDTEGIKNSLPSVQE